MLLAVLVSGVWAQQCDPARAGVVINELLANPSGDDAGLEWVEIHNGSGAEVDAGGWYVASGTSSYHVGDPLPDGTTIPAGGWLVVGQTAIPEADVVAGGFTLGNASSNADAVQLRDCFDAPVDTIVYGAPNEDGWLDDQDGIALSLAPAPPDGRPLGRDPDGADTDLSAVDVIALPYPTPGRANDDPPETCGGPASGIKVNELFPDPEGADGGLEWVELFHAGNEPVDLAGWSLEMGTSSLSARHTFESLTMLPGDRMLLGGASVEGADVIVETLSLGNASTSSDAVALIDCLGFPADTVVYGTPNDDGFLDDAGEVATSLGPVPGTDASLQRVTDGHDTDQSAEDFVVQLAPTPGLPNAAVEPTPCAPSDGSVRINEIVPDPDGSDEGLEWIELHNASSAPASVAGWALSFGTTDFGSEAVVLGEGVEVPAGGFLVVGGEDVEEAHVVASFSIGNGTGTDGVRLFDCEGATVDTALYGESPNADLLPDDRGQVAPPYGDPGSGEALARVADGVDTDAAEDWKVVGVPTPGASNVRDLGETEDPLADGPRSCGCGGEPPEPGEGRTPSEPDGGCSTSSVPPGAPALLLAGFLGLRRRRLD